MYTSSQETIAFFFISTNKQILSLANENQKNATRSEGQERLYQQALILIRFLNGSA